MRYPTSALLLVVVAAMAHAAPASDPEGKPPEVRLGAVAGDIAPLEPRPRLALVLSGGGARGAAHIGVLQVLEELHVVPDVIVGTSMGSIVGGLYSAGWSPEELEKLLLEVDWTAVFSDRVPRTERTFRRKQDTVVPLIAARLRFDGLRPYFPAGLLGGQRLGLLLQTLEIESTGEQDFDRFPVPFRAVAADVGSGEAVVIGSGSLATAMRASMSIAGAFAPVLYENRQLVDGGAVANLPIGIAQALGAEHVIAIDITSPWTDPGDDQTFLRLANRLSGLLLQGNRADDLARLRTDDVYVRPELGDISFADFTRAAEAVGIGEAAARAQIDELRRFAVSDEAWARFEARHHKRSPEELVVDEVRLENSSVVADEVVQRFVPIAVGQPLDTEALRSDTIRLYALENFDPIDVRLEQVEERNRLTLVLPREPNRAYMQFGLSLFSDADTDSNFTLTARHVTLGLNRLGGEWVNVVQVGQNNVLRSELYQPLDHGMRWFVSPQGELRKDGQPLWIDGTQVADYDVSESIARLDFGLVLGSWGELRAGGFYRDVKVRQQVGLQLFPDFDQQEPGGRVQFRVDTLDSTHFPREGSDALLEYQKSRSDETGASLDRVAARWNLALSRDRNTIVLGAEAVRNEEQPASVIDLYDLGGVFRLSGLARMELVGAKGALARAIFYRRLTVLKLGAVSSNFYAGLSGEAGNVYAEQDSVTWSSLRVGGSVFVGADTPLGPAILALGWAEPGRSHLHVQIGQRF